MVVSAVGSKDVSVVRSITPVGREKNGVQRFEVVNGNCVVTVTVPAKNCDKFIKVTKEMKAAEKYNPKDLDLNSAVDRLNHMETKGTWAGIITGLGAAAILKRGSSVKKRISYGLLSAIGVKIVSSLAGYYSMPEGTRKILEFSRKWDKLGVDIEKTELFT